MVTLIKKRLLVAPLDWGWGHLYRSLTLCREWPLAYWDFYVLAPSPLVSTLQEQFPQIHFIAEQPLGLHYPTSRFDLGYWFKPFLWLYKLISDQSTCAKLVAQVQPHLIISDSRPWFRSPKIPSVLLIHQIHPKIPGFPRMQKWFHKVLHARLQMFSRIWIPDFATQSDSLAGELSHPPMANCKYIGPISRFNKIADLTNNKDSTLLLLLTGPEFNRTEFLQKLERALLPFYNNWRWHICGITGINSDKRLFYPIPDEALLEQLLNQSTLVISRTGYTTLMDLALLQSKAILIPTPGQSEQVFLGDHCQNRFMIWHEDALHNPIPCFAEITFPQPPPLPSTTLKEQLEQECHALPI
jgi:hypothetical protein